MTPTERANAFLDVVSLLSKARTQLDALAVGDPSSVPNELKHLLDTPIERTRAYARALLLGEASTHPDTREGSGAQ